MTKTKETQSAHDFFKTSENLEGGEGVVIDYPGFAVTINRAGGTNKNFKKVVERLMKPYQQRASRGLLENETAERVLMEAYAEAVVIGWSGNIGPNGKKAVYSIENCIKVFEELPDLYEAIKIEANSISLFREEVEELEEKN